MTNTYEPFTRNSAPVLWGYGNFFMVRPRGINPNTGKVYLPSIVQMFNHAHHALYSSDDELEPLTWSTAADRLEPTQNPFDANLEWRELPE
jgi:hypothetical protein